MGFEFPETFTCCGCGDEFDLDPELIPTDIPAMSVEEYKRIFTAEHTEIGIACDGCHEQYVMLLRMAKLGEGITQQ